MVPMKRLSWIIVTPVLTAASFVAINTASAQAAKPAWSAGAEFQVSGDRFPTTAVGLHLSRVIVGGRYWDARLGATASTPTANQVERVCTLPGNAPPCDTRQVSQFGDLLATLRVGAPGKIAFAFISGGAYATNWADDQGSSAPRGAVLEGGLSWNLPFARPHPSIEILARKYHNVLEKSVLGVAARLSYSW